MSVAARRVLRNARVVCTSNGTSIGRRGTRRRHHERVGAEVEALRNSEGSVALRGRPRYLERSA